MGAWMSSSTSDVTLLMYINKTALLLDVFSVGDLGGGYIKESLK